MFKWPDLVLHDPWPPACARHCRTEWTVSGTGPWGTCPSGTDIEAAHCNMTLPGQQ